ncbi:MAG TPA: serine hydrolase domain-containing protein [Arachidicoccus sp.]|nr:serine hydrolase domain-containing protein [Arachidicoccus sp.]
MKVLFFLVASATIMVCSCGATKDKKPKKEKKEAVAHLYPADSSYFRPLSDAEKNHYKNEVEAAYHKILGPYFNGSILVAKNGQVIYEDYKGVADFRKRTPITIHTPMHLASISKTFTGMTILHLWENGQLSLDDNLQKYFPKLPYYGITIRMLLSHRTGLPNYVYFMEKGFDRNRKATNQDVINFMMANKPKITARPDRAFQYCNTNFLLLASIVEKVTDMPFPEYMKDSVFIPLGMQDSYVFSIKDTAKYIPTYSGNRPFPMNNVDCTYGDKNVYSTVRDLLRWDRSLYAHTFVKASTLKMAFTPQSLEHPSMHNYGLAWRTYFNPRTGDSIIYHNGYWHGSNTVFNRIIQDTATIILIGNKYNPNNYNAKKLTRIFTGNVDY